MTGGSPRNLPLSAQCACLCCRDANQLVQSVVAYGEPRAQPVLRLHGRRLAAAACLRSDEEGWLSSLQTLSFFGSRCTTRRESVLCALLVPSVGVQ